ncbi:MAG: trehalose-phosphatase [Alphaproteobacteria bacterium]
MAGPKLALTANDALFIDFDGTLAPLQMDPDTVWLPKGLDQILMGLSAQLDGAVCILSGRDTRDLCRRVPDMLWRAGLHGLEQIAPGQLPNAKPPPAPEGLEAELLTLIQAHSGARLEVKGPAFAIHYRGYEHLKDPLGAALQAILPSWPAHLLQGGHMVWEVKPLAANKGKCLAQMMQHSPFAGRHPIMIGDDITDEDGMQAALSLGGTAMRIGAGETCAPHGLDSPAQLQEILADWLSALSP